MPSREGRGREKKERSKLYPDEEDPASTELGDANSTTPTQPRKKDKKKKKKHVDPMNDDDPATQELGDSNADSYEMQLKKITDTQDETIDVLQGMIRMNEETIQIGQQAAERLSEQREKLHKIKNEFDELESGIQRGKKEVNAFMRGLACDNCLGKVVIIIVILLAVGILTLTILRIVKPDIFNMRNWSTEAPTPVPTTDSPIMPPIFGSLL
jgi:hypothetical protein